MDHAPVPEGLNTKEPTSDRNRPPRNRSVLSAFSATASEPCFPRTRRGCQNRDTFKAANPSSGGFFFPSPSHEPGRDCPRQAGSGQGLRKIGATIAPGMPNTRTNWRL